MTHQLTTSQVGPRKSPLGPRASRARALGPALPDRSLCLRLWPAGSVEALPCTAGGFWLRASEGLEEVHVGDHGHRKLAIVTLLLGGSWIPSFQYPPAFAGVQHTIGGSEQRGWE